MQLHSIVVFQPLYTWYLLLSLPPLTYPGGGMVDALVSNTSDASRAGSSPALGTLIRPL